MDDETRETGVSGKGSGDAASTPGRFPWRDTPLSEDQVDDDSEAVSRMLIESLAPVPPDPEVWDRVAAAISVDDQVDDQSEPTPIRTDSANAASPSFRSIASRWYAVTAVAAALVLVAGGIWIAATNTATATETAGSVTRELADPETGIVALSLTIHDDGSTSSESTGLAVLDADHTYQLWSVVGDEIVSVAVLGQDPDGVSFRIEADPAVLALTVEKPGGVAVSTQSPVAVWSASS